MNSLEMKNKLTVWSGGSYEEEEEGEEEEEEYSSLFLRLFVFRD